MNRHQQQIGLTQQHFAMQIQKEVESSVRALQQGRLDEAIYGLQKTLQTLKEDVPGHDLVTHNLLVACKKKIQQMLAVGDYPATTPFHRLVMELKLRGHLANDHEIRSAFADSLQGLGTAYSDHCRFEEAVMCFRKALSIESSPTYYSNLSYALAALGKPGILDDYALGMEPKRLGKHLFIACMPKTGSTFLKNVISGLTGFKERFFFYAHGQNEHDLYLPTVLKFANQNTVTQQHSRASHANIQMMQAFQIKPVVLVRNIFDVIMSLLDFYKGGAKINSYHEVDFEKMCDEEMVDLLIDYYLPWYFQFYASWLDAETRQRLPVHWLTYETLIEDKPLAVEKIMDFYEIESSKDAISRSIAAVESDTRGSLFNKGVAGRGQASLSAAQKERIRDLSRHYPSVNFSRIGL